MELTLALQLLVSAAQRDNLLLTPELAAPSLALVLVPLRVGAAVAELGVAPSDARGRWAVVVAGAGRRRDASEIEAGGVGGGGRRSRVRIADAPLTLSPGQRRARRPEYPAGEASPPRLALSREVLLRGRSLRRHDPLVRFVILAAAEESRRERVDGSKHRRARGTSPPLHDPLLRPLVPFVLLASSALLTGLDLTRPGPRLRLLQSGGVFG